LYRVDTSGGIAKQLHTFDGRNRFVRVKIYMISERELAVGNET